MRTALIDGDIFIFQAATANEYESQWSDWLWTLHADLKAAIEQFDDSVDRIVEDLQADKVIIALTDGRNWRKDVMPTYKHSRVTKRKPVIYQAMRDYVAETRETFQRPGLEGDDILGILSTHKSIVKGERIIVSLDKDMQTIPGLLLNDGKARKQMADDLFDGSGIERRECFVFISRTLYWPLPTCFTLCPGRRPPEGTSSLPTIQH